MLLKIIFVCFCTTTLLHNCEAKLSVECIVDYLKFRHFNVDYFASVGNYNGNPSECTDDIRSKIETIYNDVRAKYNNHAVLKVYNECIIQMISNEEYQNHKLAAIGAQMKGVGLKFWKSGDKNKFIGMHEKKLQEIEDDALVKCQGQKKFGDFFDSFYEQNKNEQQGTNFQYCMRKHLLDKNFIKTGQYSFNVNPGGISTNRISCDQIMSAKFHQMKADIPIDQCTTEKFISMGYFDDILKIQLLANLNMTPTEKEQEKQKFISKMILLTNDIKSCPIGKGVVPTNTGN